MKKKIEKKNKKYIFSYMAENMYNMGEIYKVTNKTTKNIYIGQAPKYITANNQRWGGKGRWTRHIRDATSDKTTKGVDCEFYKAIRKYGKDDFTLEIICDCLLSELDELEMKYIEEFNSLEPIGYNMTTGGRFGKHTSKANIKSILNRKDIFPENKVDLKHVDPNHNEPKKKIIIKFKKSIPDNNPPISNSDSEDNSENESDDESGDNSDDNSEDNDNNSNDKTEDNIIKPIFSKLPRCVYKLYGKNKEVIGYLIKDFPIREGDTIRKFGKSFRNVSNPEKALEEITEYVKELQRIELEKNHKEEKKDIIPENLPDNIYPIFESNKIIGYSVSGLQSYDKKLIPKRDFTGLTNTNNLHYCIKFINLIDTFNKKKQVPSNWLTVEIPNRIRNPSTPTSILETYYNGIHTGYQVKYARYIDKKKIVKSKCFTSKNLTMKEKLDLAVKQLEVFKNEK